jgi:hypothetical protein
MLRSVAIVFGRWPARPLTAEELARREARLEREGLRVRRLREGDAIYAKAGVLKVAGVGRPAHGELVRRRHAAELAADYVAWAWTGTR